MADRRVAVVTGANGFIGRRVVQAFLVAGWEVRAVVRHVFGGPDHTVTWERWALGDDLPAQVVTGADCLVHAAFVQYDTADASTTNVAGSKRLLDQCQALGVHRTIFLSSMSARPGALSQYGRDKFELQGAFDTAGELVIRPGLVLGTGGLFGNLRRFIARSVVVPLAGGGHQHVQTVHVDDLAHAVVVAAATGLDGVVTIAEPDPVEFRQLLSETAHLMRRRVLFLPVPYVALTAILRASATIGLRLPVSQDNLLGLRGLQPTDVRADLERLGVPIRDYRASLRDLILRPADGSAT